MSKVPYNKDCFGLIVAPLMRHLTPPILENILSWRVFGQTRGANRDSVNDQRFYGPSNTINCV